MTDFSPTPPEGADIHECLTCEGTGCVLNNATGEEFECSDCDGTGEWFE